MSALPQGRVHPDRRRTEGEGRMRRAMQVATVEGVLAAASDNFAAPYLSLYALALGATHAQIGLVNAVPALLTNVLQIPAVVLAERFGRRKTLTIIGGFGLRFAWLPIAFIPLVMPLGWSAVIAFILLLVLRSAFGALAVPAWTSLMADTTPRRMRGAYFSNRNMLCNLAALGGTLASGLILRLFGDPLGYQVTFGVAALFGAAAAYVFRRFPDPDGGPGRGGPAHRKNEVEGTGIESIVSRAGGRRKVRERVRGWLTALGRERSFTAYTLMSTLWNFGVTLPQPLFAVHFVETLGGSASFWGVVTAATFVTTVLGQRYWGSLTDRVGGRNVLVASGTIAALIPGLWFLAYRPEHALWINLASGLGWAGFNLAAFNLLLEVTPDANRSTYVAGYNALIGVSHFAGPLIGGVAADLIGVGPVFLLATLIRMVAWALFAFRLQTAYDSPFAWREFVPRPRGGFKRLAHDLFALPHRIVSRIEARRLERRLRQRAEERLIEKAVRQAVVEAEEEASQKPAADDSNTGTGTG